MNDTHTHSAPRADSAPRFAGDTRHADTIVRECGPVRLVLVERHTAPHTCYRLEVSTHNGGQAGIRRFEPTAPGAHSAFTQYVSMLAEAVPPYDVFRFNGGLTPPTKVGQVPELSQYAFAQFLGARRRRGAAAAEVVAFDIDPDHRGHADAFSSAGEIYEVRPGR